MAAPSYNSGTTQDSGGAQSLTFTIPGGAGSGDFMVVFVCQSENTGAQVWDDDGGGGNGWTRVAYNRTTSGRDMESAIYYKFHSGSESNPTFTWNSGGTNEPMSGIMLVYDNVESAIPAGQDYPFQGPTYLASTNDCNPPNPDVEVLFANTRVVCFHSATHDDISSVGAPTGFTIRDYVYGGSAQHNKDHRDRFSADIEVDTVGSYSPPDWTHGAANTTPEYHTYSIALNEVQNILITGGTATEDFDWEDTNLTITGKGFGATQSTGKVEYWSDATGTTKSTQTIDSWSDTSIQIDVSQGSLADDTEVYLVVTNSSSQESQKVKVNVGLVPYNALIVGTLKADHYWRLNNTYDDTGDTGPVRNMTGGVVGTWTFNTQEIVDSNTHTLNYSSTTNRRETSADSPNMNITIDSAERTVAFWLQLDEIQHQLACIWKEGGGVQNIAFFTGIGNTLLYQVADTPGNAINAQAWSDFKLEVGRPYHICGRYSLDDNPKKVALYIDGVEQTDTDGNPPGTGTFNSHSGDIVWGDPDTNLETGATDISYNTMNDAQISDFCTWSDNSGGTNAGGLDPTTEIRDILYRRGALPDDTISTGTESAMQTSVEALAENRPNWPLSLRVQPKTGGGDLELTLEDSSGNPWVFDDGITSHVEWRGATGETLTLINPVGGNLDSNKSWSATGGLITVINEVETTFTFKSFSDDLVVGAKVLVTADTGGPEPYDDSISITRSGSTATVTHTAHGMRTGAEVLIEGATQDEYNGVFTITVTSANAYTYTVSGTPATPATGSPTSTFVLIFDDTDSNGEVTAVYRYTSSQPITGKARKGTATPYYKTTLFTGTIGTTGVTQTVFMINDE